MTEMVKNKKKYFEMLDHADKCLFPVRIGQVEAFKHIDKDEIKSLFEDWEPKHIFPIEVAWDGNDPESKILNHYDGWGS